MRNVSDSSRQLEPQSVPLDSIDARIIQYHYCSARALQLIDSIKHLLNHFKSVPKDQQSQLDQYSLANWINTKLIILLGCVIPNCSPDLYKRYLVLLKGGNFDGRFKVKPNSYCPVIDFTGSQISVSKHTTVESTITPQMVVNRLRLFEVILINAYEIYNSLTTQLLAIRSKQRPDEKLDFSVVDTGELTEFPELTEIDNMEHISYILGSKLCEEESLWKSLILSKQFLSKMILHINGLQTELTALRNTVESPLLMHRSYMLILRLADLYLTLRRSGKLLYVEYFDILSRYARRGNAGLTRTIQNFSRLFLRKQDTGYLFPTIDKYAEAEFSYPLRFQYLDEFCSVGINTLGMIKELVDALRGLRAQWGGILALRSQSNNDANPVSKPVKRLSPVTAVGGKQKVSSAGLAAALAANSGPPKVLSAQQRFQKHMQQALDNGQVYQRSGDQKSYLLSHQKEARKNERRSNPVKVVAPKKTVVKQVENHKTNDVKKVSPASDNKNDSHVKGNLAVCKSAEREYDEKGNVIKKIRFLDVPEYKEEEDAPTWMQMQKQLKQRMSQLTPYSQQRNMMMNKQEGHAFRYFSGAKDADSLLSHGHGLTFHHGHLKEGRILGFFRKQR